MILTASGHVDTDRIDLMPHGALILTASGDTLILILTAST